MKKYLERCKFWTKPPANLSRAHQPLAFQVPFVWKMGLNLKLQKVPELPHSSGTENCLKITFSLAVQTWTPTCRLTSLWLLSLRVGNQPLPHLFVAAQELHGWAFQQCTAESGTTAGPLTASVSSKTRKSPARGTLTEFPKTPISFVHQIHRAALSRNKKRQQWNEAEDVRWDCAHQIPPESSPTQTSPEQWGIHCTAQGEFIPSSALLPTGCCCCYPGTAPHEISHLGGRHRRTQGRVLGRGAIGARWWCLSCHRFAVCTIRTVGWAGWVGKSEFESPGCSPFWKILFVFTLLSWGTNIVTLRYQLHTKEYNPHHSVIAGREPAGILVPILLQFSVPPSSPSSSKLSRAWMLRAQGHAHLEHTGTFKVLLLNTI